MFQIAGGSVGLGLNTTIFTSSSKSDLNSHLSTLGAKVSETQSDLVHGILAGTASGKQVLGQFSSGVAQRLSSLVRDAFVAGLHTAFRLDTALAICALAGGRAVRRRLARRKQATSRQLRSSSERRLRRLGRRAIESPSHSGRRARGRACDWQIV